MLAKRIVPCLDVRHGKVVKGVNFEGVKDVGIRSRVRRNRTGRALTRSYFMILLLPMRGAARSLTSSARRQSRCLFR